MGLCMYMGLQTSGEKACRAATNQAYNQSDLKPELEARQKELEHYGLGVYKGIPFNDELGAVSVLGYEAYKKDFKLPLTNRINLEYNNFNTYTFNFKWEF